MAELMAEFLDGKAGILCKTEAEAVSLFKWCLNKNIVRVKNRILAPQWNIHKEKTIYSMTSSGKLQVGHITSPEYHPYIEFKLDVLEFKDIPESELQLKRLYLRSSVDFDSIANQHAIRCKTLDECIELFEKLSKYGVTQAENGVCNKYCALDSTGSTENIIYVISNKRRIYRVSLGFAKEMGYKIIDLKNCNF